jgi:hypothetical protein
MSRKTLIHAIPWIAGVMLAGACDRQATSPRMSADELKPALKGEVPPGDRMTGGGKLSQGRDFATFGFQVRAGQGQLQWVQHCLDGVDPTSAYCSRGGFTFHGSTISIYGSEPMDPDVCRGWEGTGVIKYKDKAMAALYDGTYTYDVIPACDYGEPGKGVDRMSLILPDGYHRDEILRGGNIQLHKANP